MIRHTAHAGDSALVPYSAPTPTPSWLGIYDPGNAVGPSRGYDTDAAYGDATLTDDFWLNDPWLPIPPLHDTESLDAYGFPSLEPFLGHDSYAGGLGARHTPAPGFSMSHTTSSVFVARDGGPLEQVSSQQSLTASFNDGRTTTMATVELPAAVITSADDGAYNNCEEDPSRFEEIVESPPGLEEEEALEDAESPRTSSEAVRDAEDEDADADDNDSARATDDATVAPPAPAAATSPSQEFVAAAPAPTTPKSASPPPPAATTSTKTPAERAASPPQDAAAPTTAPGSLESPPAADAPARVSEDDKKTEPAACENANANESENDGAAEGGELSLVRARPESVVEGMPREYPGYESERAKKERTRRARAAQRKERAARAKAAKRKAEEDASDVASPSKRSRYASYDAPAEAAPHVPLMDMIAIPRLPEGYMPHPAPSSALEYPAAGFPAPGSYFGMPSPPTFAAALESAATTYGPSSAGLPGRWDPYDQYEWPPANLADFSGPPVAGPSSIGDGWTELADPLLSPPTTLAPGPSGELTALPSQIVIIEGENQPPPAVPAAPAGRRKPTKRPYQYPCRYRECTKMFTDQSSRSRHIETHFVFKRYGCTGCGWRAKRKAQVVDHIAVGKCTGVLSGTPEVFDDVDNLPWEAPENAHLLEEGESAKKVRRRRRRRREEDDAGVDADDEEE